MYAHGEAGPHVVYLEKDGRWQPVAAICLVGQLLDLMDYHMIPAAMPTGEFEGLDPADGCYWNDADGDAVPRRAECTIVPTATKSTPGKRIAASGLALANGWGGRPSSNLAIYTVDKTGKIFSHKPLRFTPDGAPVYGPEGTNALRAAAVAGCDTIPIVAENRLVCLGANHGGADKPFLGIDLATQDVQWRYPNRFAGVHGSHLAPMCRPGLLIGPLKVCGVADMGPDIGNVMLIRGNLGQDFFFTTDGLHVGAICRDTRLPGEPLPNDETALVGTSMNDLTEGGEPFNGWFGRQADGNVRQVSGFASQAAFVTEFKGLETIHRVDAGSLTVDQAAIDKALADNAARGATAVASTAAVIAKLATSPAGAIAPAAWAKVSPINIARQGQPERATARLGYDAKNLYVKFDVKDPSPWRNDGKDATRLFKTGDCVDLQLRTDPAATGEQPQAGDLRLLIADMGGKPTAVLTRPVDKSAPAELRKSYASPVGTRVLDRVETMPAVTASVTLATDGYSVQAAIPLATLGLAPKPGLQLRGDVGFITSDAQGMINTARIYWSNQRTNLVNDLPSEAWLYPAAWGTLTFE